jgi:hypothetical protein
MRRRRPTSEAGAAKNLCLCLCLYLCLSCLVLSGLVWSGLVWSGHVLSCLVLSFYAGALLLDEKRKQKVALENSLGRNTSICHRIGSELIHPNP